MSYPDESSSLARLDVRSWTVHAEPPSAVEPDTDRHARWWFATSELLGWAAFPLFALLVLPPLNDVPTWDPRVLIAASISWLAIAVGGVVRHRALRRRTGAPVIGELYELLEAAVPLLAYHHDQFRALPKLELAAGERIKARWVSRGGLRTMRQLQRHLLRHCELAALADRHGWKRIRNGQIRKIGQLATSFSLPTTQHEAAE